jgi:hypothetical protein
VNRVIISKNSSKNQRTCLKKNGENILLNRERKTTRLIPSQVE